MEVAISERFLVASLELRGMVDKEWKRRDIQVDTDEGSEFKRNSRDFSVAWCEVNRMVLVSSSELPVSEEESE